MATNSSDNFFSESGLIKLEDGKAYRERLHTETLRVLASMLDVLPSVYNATTPSTVYAEHLRRVALEIARLNLEAKNIQNDLDLDKVRSEYLYQKFGYQIQVNNTFFPTTNFSDQDYRNFLKAVLNVIFNGASAKNIKEALKIFTKQDIEVRDTTSKRGVIRANYIAKFINGKLKLGGTHENITNLKLSDPSTGVVYVQESNTNSNSYNFYDGNPEPENIGQLYLLQSSDIPDNTPIRVQFEYRDSIVDQFKLKIYFNQSKVYWPNTVEDILQKVNFLLYLIKPAHVLPDVRVYQDDSLRKKESLFTLSNKQEEIFLAVDSTTEQRFIRSSYDDFRRYTRNVSDSQALEFNNLETITDKISETYGDVGYYLNEPDPLYKKKYRLFQLKGINAQSSSLFNSPYDLEFNKEQPNIISNVSRFDQTQRLRHVQFPEVSPNTDLPVSDGLSDPESLKVTALPVDFGVSVAIGTLYSYRVGKIFSFDTPTEIIFPEEARGHKVYIYVDLSGEDPTLEYHISSNGGLNVPDPRVALASVNVPVSSSIIWDHYIKDERIPYFTNLTLAGDPAGFSEFNVSRGVVLGLGTRPIEYKFDDNQSEVVYKTEQLNQLNSFDFTLNESFLLGIDNVGYMADDLHFLYSNLEAEIQTSSLGSIPTPCIEGDLVLGLAFGSETEDDRVVIFEEDTTFILNDTLPRAESFTITNLDPFTVEFSGTIWESLRLYDQTQDIWLEYGLDFTWDSEENQIIFPVGTVAESGDTLVAYFYQEFGTLFNEDLLYASNSTYASFDFFTSASEEPTLPDDSANVSIAQTIPEYFGIPITGIIFNDAVLTTEEVTTYAFPEDIALILNDFTSLLNQTAEEVVEIVDIFDETAPSLLSLTELGPIEQLALEGVSIIDQATGLPVIALNGSPIT